MLLIVLLKCRHVQRLEKLLGLRNMQEKLKNVSVPQNNIIIFKCVVRISYD